MAPVKASALDLVALCFDDSSLSRRRREGYTKFILSEALEVAAQLVRDQQEQDTDEAAPAVLDAFIGVLEEAITVYSDPSWHHQIACGFNAGGHGRSKCQDLLASLKTAVRDDAWHDPVALDGEPLGLPDTVGLGGGAASSTTSTVERPVLARESDDTQHIFPVPPGHAEGALLPDEERLRLHRQELRARDSKSDHAVDDSAEGMCRLCFAMHNLPPEALRGEMRSALTVRVR